MNQLFYSNPCLRATKQRYTDEPAYLELGPTFFQGYLAAINLSVVRIEDLPASIYVPLLPHSGDDSHAEQLLIVPRTFAFLNGLNTCNLTAILLSH